MFECDHCGETKPAPPTFSTADTVLCAACVGKAGPGETLETVRAELDEDDRV